MVKRLLKSLMRVIGLDKSSWASFTVTDIDKDGRIQVELDFTENFIKRINEMGFFAETPEETVQLFFFTSMLRPIELAAEINGEEPIVSDAHPLLETGRLMK